MRRRQFISTAGTTAFGIALAGCAANPFTNSNRDVSKESVKILGEKFYKKQKVVGVKGNIKNISKWELGLVEAQATFFDSNGAKIGQDIDTTHDFEPQKTWKYNIHYNKNNIDKVTDYKLKITKVW